MDKWLMKRGQITIFFLVGLFLIFFLIIGLIIVGTLVVNFYTPLNQNITIGQVDLGTVNAQTFGQFYNMVVGHADFWGICIIFGMVFGCFCSSYFLRNRYPKIAVILDIGIIFVAFISSLYLKSIYSEIVTSLASAGQTFAMDNLTKTNFFILNLPIFTTIIGVISVVIFHAGIPPKAEELNNVPYVVT